MSTRELFLEEEVADFVTLDEEARIEYRFSGKQLQIRQDGKDRYHAAEIGDGFRISCDGRVRINRIKPPEDEKHLLMWLCGFNAGVRTLSYREFKDKFAVAKAVYDQSCRQQVRVGEKYQYSFVVNRNTLTGETIYIAAWISSELKLGQAKIVEIMRAAKENNLLRYPNIFTRKVLGERFKLSAEDFAKIGIGG